ncbi:MAG TPA: Ig-like domain-containing protein, partial [Oscillatoriaceae cyanobacterium]
MRNPIALLRRGIVLSLGLALFSAPLAGCHDAPLPVAPTSFPSTNTGGISSVTSLDIQADSDSVAAGQTMPLSLVASDDQGNATPVTAQWSTSNASIATVNASTGVVTGMHPGTVTITANANSQQTTYTLTVLAPGQTTTDPTQYGPGDGTSTDGTSLGGTTGFSTGLVLEPAQPGVLAGGQLQMAAYLPGANAPSAVSWKSSDTSIATVDGT